MPKLKISFSAVFFFALLCCFRLPAEIIIPAAAALFHEAGHAAAIALCGGKINEIILYPFGAEIRRAQFITSYTEDIIVSAAGPLANVAAAVCTLFFYPESIYESAVGEYAKLFLVNNILFAAINLLPVKTLDGGNILSGLLLKLISPDAAEKILKAVSFFFIVILWAAAVYFLFYTGCNFSLFLMCVYLFASIFLKDR